MNKDLKNIIDKFNQAQLRAVEILENEFECERPSSTLDFITRCIPIIRSKEYSNGGYKIRPHGFGMEINIDGTIIDFDFGEKGEINGFDAWRLYHFVKSNNIKTSLNAENKIEAAIESSLLEGKIIKSQGPNYYSNMQ